MKRSRPRWRCRAPAPAAADTNAGRKTKPVRFKFLTEELHDRNEEAALAKGVPEDLYDKVVIPLNLTRPGTADVYS
jgi:hypothetical protein